MPGKPITARRPLHEERNQGSIILHLGIEGDQALRPGGAQQALVGGNEDAVVAVAAQAPGEGQGGLECQGIGRVDRMSDDQRQRRNYEPLGDRLVADIGRVDEFGSKTTQCFLEIGDREQPALRLRTRTETISPIPMVRKKIR